PTRSAPTSVSRRSRKRSSGTAGPRFSIPTRACPSEGWGQPVHQRRLHRHPEAARGHDRMDGKGRCMDNIFVERLWRSLKYEEVYLHAYATVAEAKTGIGAWLG